jgi:hypothetical protein
MKQILIVMLLLAAAVLLGLLWLSPAPGDGPSQPAAPAATVEQPDAAAPVVADAPVSAPTPGAAVRKMRMPDGSELAPLNGLTEAPNPGWDPGVPYAAPVRVETDAQGKQWYVFADGSQVGTYNVYRTDLKKWEPITEVRHPKPVAPVLEENVDPARAKKQ